jgi:adenylate cyclase
MTCPRCAHENRSDARFCGGCGAGLVAEHACGACGRSNSPGQKFCDGCGRPLGAAPEGAPKPDPRAYTPNHLAEKILATRAALAGERKQVTVLFADVKGSMDLAGQLDPEQWHGIMDRFFQLLAEGVHRFEGTVNQYTGDGIMALFGAPIAHEDHAQRACYAALHLRGALREYAHDVKREHGVTLLVRMGVNSGEVVVGAIGDDLRMDYTAQGHTVGLAQRMEQLADPGTIYLTQQTARLVDGYVHLRDLGSFTVKGVQDSVRVHELEGIGALRSRLDVSRSRGFSRFVGRADEMAALEAALARVLDGHGQVIGVVADAGTGKSRLCWEFAARCRARGILVNDAHCVAHGKSVPFLPVLEFLRNVFGVSERDTPQTSRDKIAGRLLLLDERLRDSLPLVFDLMNVPDPDRPPPQMDPEARQRHLFAVARQVVQARSRREPAVAWIEDLHWLDPVSASFFENFTEAVAGTRTLFLATFRPEFHARWMQRSHYQQLPLLPLGRDATAQLLHDLLGPDASLGDLAARIGERAAGNPFFAEELVLALAEHGALVGERGAYRLGRAAEAVALPPTVQGVLAARIDRLPEREKDVLQVAAVIGREFSAAVLRQVTALQADALASVMGNLASAELVYEAALFPEVVYAFKHPLTQEVAYGSQLGERRRRVHAAVARALEAADATKLDERAALIAQHWEAAGDALAAATWHQRAAEWVGARDRRATLRHCQQVRSLVASLSDSPEAHALGVMACDGMLMHGLFAGQTDEEAAAIFAEGMERAAHLETTAPRLRLLVRFAARQWLTGNLKEAEPRLAEAWRLADESGDPFLQFIARFSCTGLYTSQGRLRDALALVDELEARCGRDPEFGTAFYGFSPYAYLLNMRGNILLESGRLGEAQRARTRALEIARARGDHEAVVIASLGAVGLCGFAGDAADAMGHVREAAVAVETGAEGLRQLFLQALGRAHLLAEEWNDARVATEQALALTRERRTGLPVEGALLAGLAEMRLGARDFTGARETAEEAVVVSRRRGTVIYDVMALLARARVGIAEEVPSPEVERDLADAEAKVSETGAERYRPLIHLERARLARRRGDEATRARELREAQRLFTDMGAPARAEQVARELTR